MFLIGSNAATTAIRLIGRENLVITRKRKNRKVPLSQAASLIKIPAARHRISISPSSRARPRSPEERARLTSGTQRAAPIPAAPDRAQVADFSRGSSLPLSFMTPGSDFRTDVRLYATSYNNLRL